MGVEGQLGRSTGRLLRWAQYHRPAPRRAHLVTIDVDAAARAIQLRPRNTRVTLRIERHTRLQRAAAIARVADGFRTRPCAAVPTRKIQTRIGAARARAL